MARRETIMVVEVTTRILRHARSSGVYANLSGHEVDYIAFVSSHGTFVAPVKSIQEDVPLKEIYSDVDSDAETTLYRVGPLVAHAFTVSGKLPRGRKRITDYKDFLDASRSSQLFKHRYRSA